MISILDCTLRDGGYLNDWDFGLDTIRYVVQRHIMAGAEMIEVGFLDERRSYDENRTIQPDTACYDRILAGLDKRETKLFAMIDYGTCSLERIAPHTDDSMLDGIRVIFKKPNKEKAIAFAGEIKKLGYLVTLQMVSITAYQDRDVLDFCDGVNELKPYAVSIVDTYGLMHQEQMMHYFELLNHNLDRRICMGYHAHNNFQMAYANSLRFLENQVERDTLIDGTAHGMGKNAGNAPLELLMMHMNSANGKHYAIEQVLETIDTCVMPIYAKAEWGYKLRFFLSASNACHPNYVTYLLSKKTIPVSTVNEILQSIPEERKLDYDKDLIERLYTGRQTAEKGNYADEEFAARVAGRRILLLGPGKSLLNSEAIILRFIREERPLVISCNAVPEVFRPDMAFISNSKRYSLLITRLRQPEAPELAVTSNISTIDAPAYILDMAKYWEGDSLAGDNALALMLNIMRQAKPEKLYLAGFDGFSANNDENFYDNHLAMADDFARLQSVNEALKQRIAEARESLTIEFLTPSRYE